MGTAGASLSPRTAGACCACCACLHAASKLGRTAGSCVVRCSGTRAKVPAAAGVVLGVGFAGPGGADISAAASSDVALLVQAALFSPGLCIGTAHGCLGGWLVGCSVREGAVEGGAQRVRRTSALALYDDQVGPSHRRRVQINSSLM